MKLRNVIVIIALEFLLFAAFAGTVGAIAQQRTFDAGPSNGIPAQDLVFIGTVTKIYPAPSRHSRRNWTVVTRVDRVVSGEFSGKTFSFMVHSPAQLGLRVGRAYTLKATSGEGG